MIEYGVYFFKKRVKYVKLKNEEEIALRIKTIDDRLKDIDKLSINELKLLYNDLIYNKTYYINSEVKHNSKLAKNILKLGCVLLDTYLILLLNFHLVIFLLFLLEAEGLRLFVDAKFVKENQNYDNLMKDLEKIIIDKSRKEVKTEENLSSEVLTIEPSYSLNKTQKLVRRLKKGD